MRRLQVLGTLILLLGALPLDAGDKIRLWQHWEPGKVYHVETVAGTGETAGPNAAKEDSLSMISQDDLTVRREAGSERKLVEVKCIALRAIMYKDDGGIESYDSADTAGSDPSMIEAFGEYAGKSMTLVYDKDDKLVDAIVPEDFPSEGMDPKQLGAMYSKELGLTLPAQEVVLGESFHLERETGTEEVLDLKGRIESFVEHEGRKQAKIVMEGALTTTDEEGKVSKIPGSKVTVETLFDLERRCVTRGKIQTETAMPRNAIGGGERETIVTTIKSIEDAPPAGAKQKP